MPEKTAKFISLQEAADRLGISYITAFRWVQSGKLATEQPLGPRTAHLVSLDAVLELAARAGGVRHGDHEE